MTSHGKNMSKYKLSDGLEKYIISIPTGRLFVVM
jgi:hypothetical protein